MTGEQCLVCQSAHVTSRHPVVTYLLQLGTVVDRRSLTRVQLKENGVVGSPAENQSKAHISEIKHSGNAPDPLTDLANMC